MSTWPYGRRSSRSWDIPWRGRRPRRAAPSSQTLLDLRVSKTVHSVGKGQIAVLLDVLNALNKTAEEGLANDNLFSQSFARPTMFIDPRRAMQGVRATLPK